jgi:hypothetical protein
MGGYGFSLSGCPLRYIMGIGNADAMTPCGIDLIHNEHAG